MHINFASAETFRYLGALMLVAALTLPASSAFAQNQAKGAAAKPASSGDVAHQFVNGKPHVLAIPNPLGLPDFLCVTDHPSGNCPARNGGGTALTGDPITDLTTLLQQGGVKYIRDLERADLYASYPCDPTASPPDPKCKKADPINSACLEAVVPLVKLVVIGPRTPSTGGGTAAAPSASANASASDQASSAQTIEQQIAAPLTAADEGLVTRFTKARLIRLAFQGTELTQGCSPLVQDEFKQGLTPVSLIGILTSGPLGPIAGVLAPL